MNTDKALEYLEQEIHSVIMATVDDKGLPVTCAVDIMDSDEKGLYFLTAKGKDFYGRLTKSWIYSANRNKGERYFVLHINFNLRKGSGSWEYIFRKAFCQNQYMYEIYPTEQSRQALTVFCLYEGGGEWFEPFKKPIERKLFTIGNMQEEHAGL